MTDEPTRLEDFPDELFLELFYLIRPKDLVKGWRNLNFHINAILRSVSISITIKNDDDFNDSLPVLQYFSSQMTSLRDDRILPDNRVDVRLLNNIRFLYLNECPDEEYKQIHSRNQPRLTRFFSPPLPWSFYEQSIFGPERFPSLISIGCPRGGSILLLNVAQPINITIRYLRLDSASYETVHKFIEYLPYLSVLTINYLHASSLLSPLSFIQSFIHRLTIAHISSPHHYLEQFLLWSGFFNLTHICWIFDTCDFEQLAHILTKFSQLKRFKLRVKTFPDDVDLNLIRLMSSWFLSLDYEYVDDKGQHKRILYINTTNKQ